jgi:hypothetical protein
MNKLLLSILLFSKIAYSQGIKNKLFSWTCRPYWSPWTWNCPWISRPRIPRNWTRITRNCWTWIPWNCWTWIPWNCWTWNRITRSRITRSRIARNRNSSSFWNPPYPSPYRQCGNYSFLLIVRL